MNVGANHPERCYAGHCREEGFDIGANVVSQLLCASQCFFDSSRNTEALSINAAKIEAGVQYFCYLWNFLDYIKDCSLHNPTAYRSDDDGAFRFLTFLC